MRAPNECPHDDVLVGIELTAARTPGMARDPGALIQRGRCGMCGSQVVRRGRHDAWPRWSLEPPERYRW
jgi:hypothetical protein